MGQSTSNEIQFEKYIQLPFVTREDVHQVRNCFEYLGPVNGLVDVNKINEEIESFPHYMQEIIDEIKALDHQVDFEEFFKIMKPRLAALKNLPDDSVVMENTSASVFCVLCPYKMPVKLSYN
jgi:hypothetical protein